MSKVEDNPLSQLCENHGLAWPFSGSMPLGIKTQHDTLYLSCGISICIDTHMQEGSQLSYIHKLQTILPPSPHSYYAKHLAYNSSQCCALDTGVMGSCPIYLINVQRESWLLCMQQGKQKPRWKPETINWRWENHWMQQTNIGYCIHQLSMLYVTLEETSSIFTFNAVVTQYDQVLSTKNAWIAGRHMRFSIQLAVWSHCQDSQTLDDRGDAYVSCMCIYAMCKHY